VSWVLKSGNSNCKSSKWSCRHGEHRLAVIDFYVLLTLREARQRPSSFCKGKVRALPGANNPGIQSCGHGHGLDASGKWRWSNRDRRSPETEYAVNTTTKFYCLRILTRTELTEGKAHVAMVFGNSEHDA
jgi:hypothetical protein